MADHRMAVVETVRKAIADGDVDFLREGMCDVSVAMVAGEIWAPHPSIGREVNVGTVPEPPQPVTMRIADAQVVVDCGFALGRSPRSSRRRGKPATRRSRAADLAQLVTAGQEVAGGHRRTVADAVGG